MPKKTSMPLAIIAVLAVAQALLGSLRAIGWFQIGSDLLGKGLLILPIVGLMAYARGIIVAGIALLYVGFALGLIIRKNWAWPLGMAAAIINLLLVFGAVVQGASFAQGVLWLVVPVIIVWQLLSANGRQACET